MAKQAHDLGVQKRKLNEVYNPMRQTRTDKVKKRMQERRDRWESR